MTEPAPADPAEPAAAPEHRLRRMAVVPMVFDGKRWVLEEDPIAELAPTPDIVCEQEGHVLSGRHRRECEVLKDRAAGAPLPTRGEVRDAFERAAAPRGADHLTVG